MTKAKRFRQLIEAEDLTFICEVHNALSARIVEEAGFPAMWGSSLTISSTFGVRDNNEASWTQILEVIEFISDVTSIPLLLDADTGYGNFNNVRRLVKKLEQRNIAAMCIEDKLFPKKNSFISGDRQPLEDIDEFAGKIKAAKDTQTDPDFFVVARIEAFIAGWGLSEALKRADAYHNAGADAILIHSKISRADEVLAFKAEWGDRCPVIIVPTKYYTTPTDVFRKAGFNAVIWANMVLRSSIKGMQNLTTQLHNDECLLNIEDRLVTVSEVFRLQGSDELEEAEKLYLPARNIPTRAVILAASQGKALGPLTHDRPKALVEVSGKPLLYRQISTLNEIGIKDITVVRGFHKDLISAPNLKYVDNDDYDTTQEVYSLYEGIKDVEGKTLISYGDVLYKKHIPTMLLESTADFTAAIDADWTPTKTKGVYADFVACDTSCQKHLLDQDAKLVQMASDLPDDQICGEWIGLLVVSANGLNILKDLLAELSRGEGFASMRMSELFNELISRGHPVRAQYIHGHWLDVDDIKDFSMAQDF